MLQDGTCAFALVAPSASAQLADQKPASSLQIKTCPRTLLRPRRTSVVPPASAPIRKFSRIRMKMQENSDGVRLGETNADSAEHLFRLAFPPFRSNGTPLKVLVARVANVAVATGREQGLSAGALFACDLLLPTAKGWRGATRRVFERGPRQHAGASSKVVSMG